MEEENEYFFDPYSVLLGTFDLQALEIWKTIKLSSKEMAGLRLLHYDLWKVMQEIWPGCQVKVFGSAATGLAFKNSDMDFFIKLPEHCADDNYNCLIITQAYVAWRKSAFDYVSAAPLATVPVITLHHVETNRKCDVTFSHSIAVETNKLLKYFLRSDGRAFKLAVLIKFWSKFFKLTMTKQLSNHAITLLVIFYLQRKKILPSVVTLQKNASNVMTEQWNTGFEQGILECSNTESLYKLLGDFFVYYSTFNFDDFVVCPYLGYPVERRKFVHPSLLPSEFRLYKGHVATGSSSLTLTRPLCVQDPFEHNNNCTVFVDELLAWKIDKCFKYAAACYKNTSSYAFLETLLLKASNIPPLVSPAVTTLQHYFPTDHRVELPAPRKGRSWKFYFCVLIFLFTFYNVFIKRSSV